MDDRRRQILATLAQMDKQFGKGSVLMLGSRAALPVEVITTGSIGIDSALGAGGFPRGRVIEVFGPESSGKTTLALHAIAEAQKAGGIAAFVDVEYALDPIYAKKLGVNVDILLVSQPDCAEQADSGPAVAIIAGAASARTGRRARGVFRIAVFPW